MIAPVLLALAMGVADSTMGFNRKMVLNHAAQSGIEEYTAAGTNWAALSSTSVQTLVAGYAGVAASNVQVTKWLECNNV
ncbi:MAG: TadE/TadG family type IV pilus assembly protein, partial [Novosphingobium sp.]